jgi:thiamine biosynthesis protein ThiC
VITIKDMPIMASRILKILERFENEAVRKIKISNSIKADNYDDVCKLTMIKNIRKAIITETCRDLPKNHYPLEDLLTKAKINL